MEPFWDLFIRQPFEHQPDEIQIEFRSSIDEGLLKVLDQTLTALHPSV